MASGEDSNDRLKDGKTFCDDPQSPSECDEAEGGEKMLEESGSEIHSPSGSSEPVLAAEELDEGHSSGAVSSHDDMDEEPEDGVRKADAPMSPDVVKSDQEPDTTQMLERVDSNSEDGESSNLSDPHDEGSNKCEALEDDGDSALTGPEPVTAREVVPASPEDSAPDFAAYRGEAGGRVPHGALDHHEGELDFEEEVNEERREETDSVGEVDKAADDESSSIKKEEGELVKDDKKEDDDDGEVEDDDDLEEGEVKEATSTRKVQQKPICRFFNKGQCTWGTSCRFLHPGINDKGNYNMFAPARPLTAGNGSSVTGHGDWQGNGQRVSPTFFGHGAKWSSSSKQRMRAISLTSSSKRAVVRSAADPVPHDDPPQYESAWERGLRHAKEILKKSSKRKESEPDFEDKRLNLSSGAAGNDALLDYEKENEYYSKSQSYGRNNDNYNYSKVSSSNLEDGYMDQYDRQAHEYWRGGNYENFEVRYTRTEHDYRDRERERTRNVPREREREQVYKERERERDRSRRDKVERVERPRTPERNWRESRFPEVQSSRNRGDEWRDPWRRCDHTLSTTPKRRGGSRSFSSHSSASYTSSRSRRSSSYSSYSGSSSGSSYSSYSSPPRSQTRGKVPQKRRDVGHAPIPVEAKRKAKQVPVKHVVPPVKPSRPPARQAAVPAPVPPQPQLPPPQPQVSEKVKQVEKQQQQQQQQQPRPQRARSPTPSESDTESTGSESSISFSSVSSASSRSSRSSKGYRKEMRVKMPDRKDEKKHVRANVGRKLPKEIPKKISSDKQRKLELVMAAKMKSSVNAARVEQMYDGSSKDPLKQTGHKQQIKLTLLNKPVEKVQVPVVAPPKKEPFKKELALPERKPKPQSQPTPPLPPLPPPVETKVVEAKPAPLHSGGSRKRPLSPAPVVADTTTVPKHHSVSGAGPKQSPAVSSSTGKKSSTSSRREELLKQLKAIEDAIARKRAKPS